MTNSNKVFVSAGVYTSEKDLTFVAQSVGVTTLGMAGETLQGPAFEPILITNFDEFRTYFGNTSPSKDGAGNPKYELPYFAKSYLQESNQLFVTRILGLTGYKPYNTFGIVTLGGVTLGSLLTGETGLSISGDTLTNMTGSTIYNELSDKTAFNGQSITDYILSNYSGFTSADDGKWFVIGEVPLSGVTSFTSSKELVSPLTNKTNSNNNNQKEWYNIFYTETTPGDDSTIDGVYSYAFVYVSGSSRFDVTRYKYDASLNNNYADVVVGALRSRGRYSGQTLLHEVTSSSSVSMSGTTVLTNPLSDFVLQITGLTGGAKQFTCNFDQSSTKYIAKVLGEQVFDKDYSDFPLYIHENYHKLLKAAYDRGLIRGLSTTLVYNLDGNDFLGEWDTPSSPMVVSEVRGGKVSDLFQIMTISDGDYANFQYKIMIQNVNLETGEFDLLVRDFNDSDDNMIVLEKYSRCSMNPELPGYIGRKIGTVDGEYELRSKLIMISLVEEHPTDAIPCGFKGFGANTDFASSTIGSVIYKTEYYDAGDIVVYDADGTPVIESGDKIRKVSLGLSSQMGFDSDLFKYKGSSGDNETYGFHLSVNASGITGNTNSGFLYKTTPYDLEGQSGAGNKLTTLSNRKFTFAVFGGNDGWDIYRDVRTNTDGYIFGKTTYISGNTTNGGVFSTSVGNSDYYAYLRAIQTFSNPEAVDINLFTTPGIDFLNHSSLVNQAIDMVETDRADSLYIMNAPGPVYTTNAEEVSGFLDGIAVDSNYSATYWPWIQVRDVDNSTQLYIPPTGEVLKNIALTDNVSYPWFAVAGYSRGLVNAIKANKKLTLDERDELYKNRINPIATFSDTGTIIWGNKTLQVRESALDRINVRRLLLRARKLISAVAVRLLFEQNDEQVRNEFLRLVNPILESIKKERGLTEFRVTVSNDPEDIDANTLRGKIYIKPTRSLEFIDLEFIITPTGASFENI
jgi:hypothetical protein